MLGDAVANGRELRAESAAGELQKLQDRVSGAQVLLDQANRQPALRADLPGLGPNIEGPGHELGLN